MRVLVRQWRDWWMDLQPEIRGNAWPLRDGLEEEDVDWGSLSVGGRLGIFMVIMSLSWCLHHAKGVADRRDVAENIADVTWVLEQMTETPREDVEVGQKRKGKASAGGKPKRART